MIGQRLAGRYRVLAILSQGGTCRVYLCEDLRIPGARWVVKAADPAAVPAGVRLDAMMEQEAALLAHIGHPAIHRVVDRLVEEDCLGLVLDYVPGETLEDRIHRLGPLEEAQALRVAEALVDLLDHVHGLEPAVILVDLHPSNIMIGPRASVHVVDLGMARLGPGPAAGGRPGFVAPECARTAEARSDLYSLGAVLRFMLTGGASLREPRVSRRSAALLRRCLAADPQARFESAACLRRALGEARAGLENTGRLEPVIPPWVPLAAATLSLLSLLLLGGGWAAARAERRVLPYGGVGPDSPLKVRVREELSRGRAREALGQLQLLLEKEPEDGEACILLENLRSPEALELPCLVSLSGLGRGQALEQLQGLSLAQREINRSGGIRGRPLSLVLCDDRSTIEGALGWAQKLGQDPSVPLVLGPSTSERALALELVLGRHGLPALSTGASHPRAWSGQAGVFTVAGPLTVRIAPLVDDLLSRGLRRVCLLYAPQEEMGRDLAYFVKDRLEAGGGRIVCELSYPLEASDFRDLIPAIRRSAADVVFFSATPGSRVGEFARDLREGGLTMPLYSNMVGYGPALVEAGGKGVEGMRLVESFHPASRRPEVRAFVSSFQRAFPQGAPTRSTAQGYDAVRVAAQILEGAGPDRGRIGQALAAMGSTRPVYRGVSGWVSPGRQPAWEPAYILELRGPRYVLVEALESPPEAR